ncbi:hypothetical protein LCGC14_2825690 [marine sediment metagenome]|uniref:Uncharacterized protein n=1 Tax=marine sediment metagenome TaxID=412755 RepID=A0A0F8YFG8_9ZZZZ
MNQADTLVPLRIAQRARVLEEWAVFDDMLHLLATVPACLVFRPFVHRSVLLFLFQSSAPEAASGLGCGLLLLAVEFRPAPRGLFKAVSALMWTPFMPAPELAEANRLQRFVHSHPAPNPHLLPLLHHGL